MGFNNRLAYVNSGPYVFFGTRTPTQLSGLNSAVRPTDRWPKSLLNTTLGQSLPAGVYSNVTQTGTRDWNGVLRKDDWNTFAMAFTRIAYDPILINGARRNCAETLKIEWKV